jgi:hypothetical protein
VEIIHQKLRHEKCRSFFASAIPERIFELPPSKPWCRHMLLGDKKRKMESAHSAGELGHARNENTISHALFGLGCQPSRTFEAVSEATSEFLALV